MRDLEDKIKRAHALAGGGSLSLDRSFEASRVGYSQYNTSEIILQERMSESVSDSERMSACSRSSLLVNTYEYNFRRVASRRYALMQGIKKLPGMSEFQVSKCMSFMPMNGKREIELVKRHDEQLAFKNLKYCSSVWLCPVCSSRISSERRKELAQVAEASGSYTALITFTLAHSRADRLEDLLGALRKALNSTKSGRWYEGFLQEHEIIASASSLEFTYGDNGWHPHIHWLVFLRSMPNSELIQEQLSERFGAFIEKQGHYSSSFHGIDVRSSRKDVSGYISKWCVIDEVSNVQAKRAKGASLTSWQLAQLAVSGDAQAQALWLEYAKATFRKKALTWSRGAREALGLSEDIEDEVIQGDELVLEDEHICFFTPQEWYFIQDHALIGEVHHQARINGAQGVNDLMIRIRGRPLEEILESSHYCIENFSNKSEVMYESEASASA